MRNVDLVMANFSGDYDDLVARKHFGAQAELLVALRGYLQPRYNEYWSHRNQLEQMAPLAWHPEEKKALESCYSSGGKFKADLLERTHPNHDLESVICPYCQVDNARTWDHFLPDERFPEFSVYAPNLIRGCDDCNRRKNEFGIGPPREVVNAYFDPVSTVRYLKCEIGDNRGRLFAKYSFDPDIANVLYNSYVAAIVKRHFNRFEIERKWRAESSSEIATFLESARDWTAEAKERPTRVRDSLEKWIRRADAAGVSQNDRERLWRTALLGYAGIDVFL